MSAAPMASEDGVAVVDLDSLSMAELIQERAAVAARIPMIDAQLKDKDRRPPTPEDDSPAWEAYRDWRRRARWAFAHHRRELVEIKAVLSERRDAGMAANVLRRLDQAKQPPADVAARELSPTEVLFKERGRLIREALETESAEGLLLRSYRALRHLLAEAFDNFPDELDEQDREAVVMLGIYCRQRYGVGRVKRFVETGEVLP